MSRVRPLVELDPPLPVAIVIAVATITTTATTEATTVATTVTAAITTAVATSVTTAVATSVAAAVATTVVTAVAAAVVTAVVTAVAAALVPPVIPAALISKDNRGRSGLPNERGSLDGPGRRGIGDTGGGEDRCAYCGGGHGHGTRGHVTTSCLKDTVDRTADLTRTY
ncbi:hypothetical protein [Streptomyces sp. NPDC059460]|uniref:hypothetical protein n=1 Tax=Streptomyces sp. NPDC059460 TaxID=3346840 RepID=UPI0036976D87